MSANKGARELEPEGVGAGVKDTERKPYGNGGAK